MTEPKIILENYEGRLNVDRRYEEWKAFGLYKNLATVWVTPTRGTCGTRVAFSWMNVMGGFNQPLVKICVEAYEVGQAYNNAVNTILSNPALAKFPYMLTVEEDNTPPPDGIIKLYDSIQHYDVVGGLYHTKGEGGVPMIWGDPKEPNTYVPQAVVPDTLQQCNGLGMGFTLFKTEIFRNPGFKPGEWFKTIGDTSGAMTQDLFFFQKAATLGYKFACDNRVKVGHFDINSGVIW